MKNRQNSYLTTYISQLGRANRSIKEKSNFLTKAIVVLPDHMHFVGQMPKERCNYSLSIRLIKTQFTQALLDLNTPLTKDHRGYYNLWQHRFWEHRVRDEKDMQAHVDYIHYNPLKHGYVLKAVDWPYSSIHGYIKKGLVGHDWGC